MDTSVIAGTLSIVANNGLGFAKFLNRLDFLSNSCISATDSITDQIPPSSAAGPFHLSAALFPVATVAPPPPLKSISRRSASRTVLRRKRRTKRRLHSDDSEGGEEDNGFGGGGGDFDGSHGGDFDGSHGGGGGRGGGGGWNFDRFEGSDWDESASSSSSNPAYYFVYEVVCWIALSNCVHFAFKKVVRFAADAIGNSERGKLSMRLISVC